MKIAIHQPEHLPWLGFFHKINMADIFVVLDNVQYRRRYFQNRNKIRTKSGELYITVPVVRANRDALLIKEVRIFRNDLKWKRKNIESIFNAYSKAKYFNDYADKIREIYLRDYELLINMNLEFIKYLMQVLRIKTEIILSSSLKVNGRKENLIMNICKELKADTYISGISGKNYLNTQDFKEAGIKLIYQEFHHPIYKQLYEPFLSCMSVIDLLFNYGDKSLSVMNGTDVAVMEKVFL